ncbi:hypothetical protein CBR_g23502 [Chara braunii]|uniref:Ribosomal RNA-processing protein 14/surfeit locus protein 6 C-terminal domain-containing protein n=1 Tax=Chara braunii TaxID=69332 RepID=A0A388L4E3_CHABU|nr:hypothetical protein CBR_g23502 [Chara braunii]|eukprot:GBG77176.1 hypothetical protein CBR_g23502 [Chara braunii]
MSKKNKLSTRRNRHEFDLKREKEVQLKKAQKDAKIKEKLKAEAVIGKMKKKKERRKKGFKVGKKSKVKLANTRLLKAKGEQAMDLS